MERMTAPTHTATMTMMATDAAATMHHVFQTASSDPQSIPYIRYFQISNNVNRQRDK